MKDNPKHQGKRQRLVSVIHKKGVRDVAVLEALAAVPRHLFLDSGFEGHAYEDKPFPIGAGQTISQPYTVARQTELLGLKKGDKVLEIGTGSGYQAAILIEMGLKVYTVERQKELFKKTNLLLPGLGYKPRRMFFGDGYKGLPDYAPFDGIVVTAGAPYVPKPLMEQLAVGGRLVIPLGTDTQVMTVYTRKSETAFEKKEHGDFRFVPLLKDKE